MTRLALPGNLSSLITRIRTTHKRKTWFNARLIITVAVAVGVVLRLAAWTQNRSLWLDEVYLALNITGRSLAGLWHPLDHDQGAPIGFLLLTKLVTLVAGQREFALRLVPLAAGIGAILLFPRVAGRLLPAGGAAFATILFAVTPKLIYYSSELKQYSSDVFVTLVLLDLMARPWGLTSKPVPVVRLAAIGWASIWFSHTALIVLAGLGVVLAADSLAHKNLRQFCRLLLAGVALLVSFSVCYVVSLRDLGQNAYLLSYWNEYFAPVPPRNFEQLGWYARAMAWLFEGPAGMNFADVSVASPAVLLFAFGVASLSKSRPWLAAALLAPLAVALAASAMGCYPFGGRLLLFAVPLLHLGLGAGWSAVAVGFHVPATSLALVTAAAVAGAPSLTAAQRLVRPQITEDPRGAVAFLAANWQPGDRVYLSAMAREPFTYYAAQAGLNPDAVIVGQALRKDWQSVSADVPTLSGRGRIWLFVTHEQGPDHRFLTWSMGQLGTMVTEFRAPGAAAYLYDMNALPERSASRGPEQRTRATASAASPNRHGGG